MKWILKKWYKPVVSVISGNVEVFYCFRLTKVKILFRCVWAPIRMFHGDSQETYDEISPYVRKVVLIKIKSSYNNKTKKLWSKDHE